MDGKLTNAPARDDSLKSVRPSGDGRAIALSQREKQAAASRARQIERRWRVIRSCYALRRDRSGTIFAGVRRPAIIPAIAPEILSAAANNVLSRWWI